MSEKKSHDRRLTGYAGKPSDNEHKHWRDYTEDKIDDWLLDEDTKRPPSLLPLLGMISIVGLVVFAVVKLL